MKRNVKGTTLLLKQGDLTLEEVDAVVNAANASLMGGGGVDGAIHRRGGSAILEDCRRITQVYGPLPTGQAVITTGGDLKACHVIHTVGPMWSGGEGGEEQLLRDCYVNCLALAQEEGLKTVSFPSISTGAYRYPVEEAARVAITAVVDFLDAASRGAIQAVTFVVFSDEDLEVYRQAFEEIIG